MTKRIMLLSFVALAAPVTAQAPAPPAAPTAPAPKDDLVRVALATEAGRIVIALDRGRAPVTAANFLDYVENGKLDGECFYRAMPYGKGGLIQGGILTNALKLLPPIAHESTAKTGLKHFAGSVAMASLGPGTARSDFFILTTDIPAFDASTSGPGFAVFGRVVEGMDVVKKILASPVSLTRGEGSMKGQMLEPAVKITKAARIDP